jgi:hypothetical protein
MSEQLQYYEHTARFKDPIGRGESLNEANEIHELAADMQHIGAVALFSEVQAGNVTATPIEVTVPNPVTAHHEKRTVKGFYGSGRERHNRITSALTNASESLTELKTGLDIYSASGAINGELQDIYPNSLGIQVLKEMPADGNHGMILRGADMSPFLKVSKDLTAEAQSKDPKEYSWGEWFNTANDEQLTNFSQWYTARLKTLADPESKAAFIRSLKSGYKNRVSNAMAEGWIPSGKVPQAALATRMARADVRFFSPFGRMPDHVGGLSQKRGSGKTIVLLPTFAGEQVTVHEFGHVFAGIDGNRMRDYFTRSLGKEEVWRKRPRIEHLHTILNEGYNEHMTMALVDGDPTAIRPTERDAKGIIDSDGSSELYKSYREVFGVLMGGKEGITTKADIKEMVESMVVGNFGNFAYQVNQKWDGRDVITEVLEVVARHDNDRWNNLDNPDYNDELLVKKIITNLQQGIGTSRS